MSQGNGVIRIGRKGMRSFAFGAEGSPFEIDVVEVFQRWIVLDDSFRPADPASDQLIPTEKMPEYHEAAQAFVSDINGGPVTRAEALDFLARLREEYDELAVFFRPRSRERPASPATSGPVLLFSEELPAPSPTPSTS